MLPKLIRTSATSRFLSMEVPHLGRIFMRYTLPIHNKSLPISRRVYLRLGNSVLLIVSTCKSRPIPMLRSILMNFLICHRFILTAKSARSSAALSSRLSEVICTTRKSFEKSSNLLRLCERYVPQLLKRPLLMFLSSRVLRIDYSQDVVLSTKSLILCELQSIDNVYEAFSRLPASQSSEHK